MVATKNLSTIVSQLEYADDARIVEQVGAQHERVASRMASTRHKIAVMSGKGGVGKSMTAVNLALALARLGHRVGILDLDLNGPCIPKMLGIDGASFTITDQGAVPPTACLGIKVASMAFLLDGDAPLRWTGPSSSSAVWLGTIEMTAVRELLADVVWGELDFLIIDLPPGAAADKPPVLAALIADLAGAIVVTTPSEVASAVVRKSIVYAKDLGIRILGLVANMAGHRCAHCGVEEPAFDANVDKICEDLDVPLLGRIPDDRELARSFDRGEPLLDAAHPTITRYDEIARRTVELVDLRRTVAQYL